MFILCLMYNITLMARRKRNVKLTTVNIQVEDKELLETMKLISSEQLDAVIHRLILMKADTADLEYKLEEQIKATLAWMKRAQDKQTILI